MEINDKYYEELTIINSADYVNINKLLTLLKNLS